jgi:hypothetical protein
MPIRALGKGSVASALNVLMSVITVLGWIGFVFSAVLLVGSMVVELLGGELKLPGFQVYNDVPLTKLLLALPIMVVMFGGFILIAGQLKKILQTLVSGDPFVPENAKRLRRLSYIVAGMEICRYIISLTGKAFQIDPNIDLGNVFVPSLVGWAGVITLWVLSQVFAEGTRLREEEKMTI